MNTKPRMLLVQPNMQPPGGGGAVSAWAAEALQDDFELDALTWTPLEVNAINRFYGTTLDTRKIKNMSPPKWLRTFFQLDPDPWSFQRLALLMRWTKWLRHKYALVLSFCDEADFGARAIQYIHFPFFGPVYERDRALQQQARWRAWGWQRRPWRVLAGFSFARMKQNLTLVNSDWTGAHFTRFYGAPTQTLYPPVYGKFPEIAWEERENGFVCIGRFCVEKRYDDIIAILQELRARGLDVHLHIVGARMPNEIEMNYYPTLRKLVEVQREWVTLHENLARAELAHMVARHRYGIHGMREEHFGIAPAEMARAGCIVFVPNDGGQVEIVGDEPRLRYDTNADAVEKIARVLHNASVQNELRAYLKTRAELFSPERFMRALRAIVAQELELSATRDK